MIDGDKMHGRSTKLILPALGPIYDRLGEAAFTLMRVVSGVGLAAHGAEKITAPMGNVGMVESLGFYPGWFFSPALAITEFFGGILIALGLLTRPAAAAATFGLAVTIYAHGFVWADGYFGTEKSLLWTAMMLYIVFHGGGKYALDRAVGREF